MNNKSMYNCIFISNLIKEVITRTDMNITILTADRRQYINLDIFELLLGRGTQDQPLGKVVVDPPRII